MPHGMHHHGVIAPHVTMVSMAALLGGVFLENSRGFCGRYVFFNVFNFSTNTKTDPLVSEKYLTVQVSEKLHLVTF